MGTADDIAMGQVATAEAAVNSDALRMQRRVARFRRGGMLCGCGDHVTIERACEMQDLVDAYQLVHEVYLQKGFIAPQPGGLRLRAFEALPQMATFVAKVDGRVAAVTSIVPDNQDLGLPSDKAFRSEIDGLRHLGKAAEITNLAIHPDLRGTPVFFQLTRACFAHAVATACDNVFIAISPEHARFFETVLPFDPWGDRRSYSAEIEDLVEGKRLCLDGLEQRLLAMDGLLGPEAFLFDFYYQGNSHHRYVRIWSELAGKLFKDQQSLTDLFVTRSNFLDRCTDEEFQAIGRQWGDEIFEAIRPASRRN